jgi:DNA invertase Pin-like site-specific DNA recombinase
MTELVRAAGYVRVSTRQQEREGLSLDEQKATLTTECARQDWRLETIVTEAKSGRTIENRQLALLLDQLDRGEYDVLIVTHMDRISRSLLDFLQVVDRSHRNGWSVRMMYPNVDTRDPWGKAMRQKTREGLAHARARGTFRPGEHLRYGDEATIRRIMRWNARGVGSDTIAERLMAEGVPTAGGGAVWHGKTIRRIINREKEKTCS